MLENPKERPTNPGSEPGPHLLVEELTPQEVKVMRLLLNPALKPADIAGQLVVSEATINFHLKNIYSKLGVTDRYSAVCKFAALNPQARREINEIHFVLPISSAGRNPLFNI